VEAIADGGTVDVALARPLLFMNLEFRQATENDISRLVGLLADDELGATREDSSKPLNQRYIDAFRSIDQDPNNELTIVERDGELVGMLQLTFIEWAIKRATEANCSIVQLTSDKRRPDALRFYESLGFEATHEGFKLRIRGIE
jgi:hypothetical protein